MLSKKAYGDTLLDHEADYASKAYRNLAVQVLRYVRGAGDLSNMVAAIHHASDVSEKLGGLSQGSVAHLIGDLRTWEIKDHAMSPLGEADALNTICSGALQVVASRISRDRQGDPESKGMRQLLSGISSLNDGRAEAAKGRT